VIWGVPLAITKACPYALVAKIGIKAKFQKGGRGKPTPMADHHHLVWIQGKKTFVR